MSINSSNISSLSNLINKKDTAENIASDLSSAVNSPITGIINKTLFKINDLTNNIENKIVKLQEDAVNNFDNKGTIKLINNVIVITVKPEDVGVANLKQQKIQNNIDSINKTLILLQNSLSTLNTISSSIRTISTALDVQEKILNLNPVSKATFTVFKKAIKIIFLKEILKEQSKVIDNQLKSNKNKLDELLKKFSSLKVQIKISDEKNQGKSISEDKASELIINDFMNNSEIKSTEYSSSNGLIFIFKIEKYDKKQLIGKAYEKNSNMIKAQTAPSFISTPEDLYKELENIIEN